MIIFTNGCFDQIHIGHVRSFKYARSLGDRLIVGLNSDDSVRRLKGPGRPVYKEKHRKEVLESIRYVDQVIIFDEDTPLRLIKEVKPDIIVKGGDYKLTDVVGREYAEVKIFPLMDFQGSVK